MVKKKKSSVEEFFSCSAWLLLSSHLPFAYLCFKKRLLKGLLAWNHCVLQIKHLVTISLLQAILESPAHFLYLTLKETFGLYVLKTYSVLNLLYSYFKYIKALSFSIFWIKHMFLIYIYVHYNWWWNRQYARITRPWFYTPDRLVTHHFFFSVCQLCSCICYKNKLLFITKTAVGRELSKWLSSWNVPNLELKSS